MTEYIVSMRLKKINLILAIMCVSWGQEVWGSKGVSQGIPSNFALENSLASYQTQGEKYTEALWKKAGNTKPGEYMNQKLFEAMTNIKTNIKNSNLDADEKATNNIKLFLEGIKRELKSIFKTSRLLGASGQEKIRALIVIIDILKLTNLDWSILSTGDNSSITNLLQDGKISSAQCIKLFESKKYINVTTLNTLTPVVSPSSNYKRKAVYQFDQDGNRKDTNNNISNREQQTLELVNEATDKSSLYTRTLLDFTLDSNGQISSVDFNKIHKTAKDSLLSNAKDSLPSNESIADIILSLGKAIYLFEQQKASGVITAFKYDSYLVQKLTKFFYKEMRDTYNQIIIDSSRLSDLSNSNQIKIHTIIQITRGIMQGIQDQNTQLANKDALQKQSNISRYGVLGSAFNRATSGLQSISGLGPQIQTDFKQLLLQNCLRILYVYEALNLLETNTQTTKPQPINTDDTDTDDTSEGEVYVTI